ncbi:polysaccharide deacetylase family protein [Anaerophaga thermohalophila]|uniref:polysaccharide deacetylase family protein n=1 Tax=Anaerophaga thermohalophila TaxID=177400 RepID=UPI000237B925|nr:polysaccharide deacetylase family protein [Anaerophaga thermohalophila]
MSFLNRLTALELRLTGVSWILRHTFQKKKVTILMFHKPLPEDFEKAVVALKKRYNILPFSQFIDQNLNAGWKLPPRPLVITLDDGWASNYSLLPVIEKHKVPVIIFLMAEIADTKRQPWFKFMIDKHQKQELRKVSDSIRIATLKHLGFEETKEYSESLALNRQEILTMQASGLVEFGSHTLFHPILPRCNDAKARREIEVSKQKVEALTGRACRFFSFPNGEYSERDIRLCKKAGYEAAVTLDVGFNDPGSDPFRLKRISVPDKSSVSELLIKASGFWAFFKVIVGKQPKNRRHSGL